MKREKIYIYGKHALFEALENAPHVIKKVYLAPDVHDRDILSVLDKKKIPIDRLKRRGAAQKVGKDTSHQGVVAVMDPTALLLPFEDFISRLPAGKNHALVLLDELRDPHNVGAIIRSAAAFGASGVLIPEHNQAPVTGAVVKTSAGMAFRIPLVDIGNVNYTVRLLKQQGFRIYGMEMSGTRDLSREQFDTPAVFIIGNEGEGIRQKTSQLCDVKLRIPMHARAESLNASVSAAVVLYQWSLQHKEALS